MTKQKQEIAAEQPDALFGRVAAILDHARGNVVRVVNTQMVLAYWSIGREIVEAVQGGEARAAYGTKVIADLSKQLAERYGQGFSVPNLKNFRQFFQAYPDRCTSIGYPTGCQSSTAIIPHPMGGELTRPRKSYPLGTKFLQGFSPQLTRSHYRALLRVDTNRRTASAGDCAGTEPDRVRPRGPRQ